MDEDRDSADATLPSQRQTIITGRYDPRDEFRTIGLTFGLLLIFAGVVTIATDVTQYVAGSLLTGIGILLIIVAFPYYLLPGNESTLVVHNARSDALEAEFQITQVDDPSTGIRRPVSLQPDEWTTISGDFETDTAYTAKIVVDGVLFETDIIPQKATSADQDVVRGLQIDDVALREMQYAENPVKETER